MSCNTTTVTGHIDHTLTYIHTNECMLNSQKLNKVGKLYP